MIANRRAFRKFLTMVEIVMAIFIVGTSLIPLLLTFSASNRNVEVTIDEFECVNTVAEIQEQVRQFPFAKALKLEGAETQIFSKGTAPVTKLREGLELHLSPPAESCQKITLKFKRFGTSQAQSPKILFLIQYEMAPVGGTKGGRVVYLPGIIGG